MAVILYNTATRTKTPFTPIDPTGKTVTLYTCGPTVYSFAHIGNMRAYIFADTLRRTLEAHGYSVFQIINITDVGHLVSDADDGEDKVLKGAMRDGISVEEVIARYTKAFIEDITALHIEKAAEYPDGFPRATAHIPEQLALIETLEAKGYAYRTSDGMYFDTSKFPRYADFAKLDLTGLREGARVAENTEKRNSSDFALWKFSSTEPIANRVQEWDSPWGIGFPGWHIECSAMAMKYLGETLDIHTGGIDHIPVHHTNEIAQSECATDVPFVHTWMHSGFMNIDGEKMSKSLGNTYRLTELSSILGETLSPEAFRYWLLTAHYRTTINFTKDALIGAKTALDRLRQKIAQLDSTLAPRDEAAYTKFLDLMSDDLNTPGAIAFLHEFVKDEQIPEATRRATCVSCDILLQVDLVQAPVETKTIPLAQGAFTCPSDTLVTKELESLIEAREAARQSKSWAEADHLRAQILELGYLITDGPEGPVLTPKQ